MLSLSCEKEPQKQYPWLGGRERTDVLVIGGGVCACMAAYLLARRQKDTVLLSAQPIGNDSGNALPFSAQGFLLLHTLCRKTDIGEAVHLLKETDAAAKRAAEFAKEHSIPYANRDILLAASDPHDLNALEDEYRLRLHNGLPVEMLVSDTLREQYSFPMKAALLIPDGTFCADPVLLAQTAAAFAEKSGARIYEQSAVISLTRKSGRWIAETDTGRSVTAQHILLTPPYSLALSDYPRRRIFASASVPCPDFSGYQSKASVRFFGKDAAFAVDIDDRVIVYSEESAAVVKVFEQRRYEKAEEMCAKALCGTRPVFPSRRAVYTYEKNESGLPHIEQNADGIFLLHHGADELTAAFSLEEELSVI